MNLVEQVGSGILRMKQLCVNYNVAEPKIIIEDNWVTIVFFRATPKTTPKTTLSDKILDLIKNNNKITREQVAKELGISINTVKEYILKLKKNGILTREAGRKEGYWEVLQK